MRRPARIRYELTYEGLVDVRQGHIHFEKPALNGGIMLWLCDSTFNPAPAPSDVPTCPTEAGTVTGTLISTDVRGLANQRFNAEDFDSAVAQIRNGLTYANVHTVLSPGGQIRGQIGQGGGPQVGREQACDIRAAWSGRPLPPLLLFLE